MRLAARPALVAALLSLIAAGAYVVLRGIGGADPAPTTAPATVTRLPEFVLEDLDGVPTPITSWPGKALVVNFWATWCAPCLREIPMLKAFHAEHPDVQVVGIAIDSRAAVEQFAAEMEFNYPVLVGPDALGAAAAFGIDYLALPLTVFVGPDETLLATHLGELHATQLAEAGAVFADLEAGRSDVEDARARLEGRR